MERVKHNLRKWAQEEVTTILSIYNDGSWKAHPILYEVLELFQGEQAASKVTILQLEAGGAHRQKWRKVIQREQKIKTCR